MTYINLCSGYQRISFRVLVIDLPLENQFIHSPNNSFKVIY